MSVDLKSKFLGCMVGSALGDAIGELAFLAPLKDDLISRIQSQPRLSYTDDTAMALGIAESVIEIGDIQEEHLGNRFSENFFREPWRGYASGPPTIFAMVRKKGVSYTDAAAELFGGSGSYGNGAAMRAAPAGLFFHRSEHLYDRACRSARVTHAHPVGMDGAAVQAAAVAEAVQLDPSAVFPSEGFRDKLIAQSRTKEIREKMQLVDRLIRAGAQPDAAARRIGRSVAVHESMPFSMFAFLSHPHGFEEALFCAILHGGDRDTLGAMTGAISGSYLGIDAIPLPWREKLENGRHVEGAALGLLKRFRQDPG